MTFKLPPLPYAKDALSPMISEVTVTFHRERHHQGYLDNLNNLTKGTPFETLTLEDVIEKTVDSQEHKSIFNNAAQVWNHSFYWDSMLPQGGGSLKEGPLEKALVQTFGSIEKFKEMFQKAALSQFGSGWAWLVMNVQGNLAIQTTGNADVPFTSGSRPLFTCDVWEHAYYLDYQNLRVDYVKKFMDHLINWEFAENNFRVA
jgi:Fe-Mn family superoxide dismutase